jgi:enoyl-[acyl-carrier-protein] reductase (NADH)
LVTQDEVGELARFLVSRPGRALTGNVLYVDGGLHILS